MTDGASMARDTPGWLLEPMIERCGFRIEDAAYSEDGLFGADVLRAT